MDLLEADVPLHFTSVMSMGVMLFQLYMVVLGCGWRKSLNMICLPCNNAGCEAGDRAKGSEPADARSSRTGTLMLVLAVLLGAYTGFLLSG